MFLDVESVVEFKTVHGKDHPDEVAESLSAYSEDKLVMGIITSYQEICNFLLLLSILYYKLMAI